MCCVHGRLLGPDSGDLQPSVRPAPLSPAPNGHELPAPTEPLRPAPATHLPLDVSQQAAGAQAEEMGAQPLVAQLLLHQGEPHHRLLGRADAPRRLEAHLMPQTVRTVRTTHHGNTTGPLTQTTDP